MSIYSSHRVGGWFTELMLVHQCILFKNKRFFYTKSSTVRTRDRCACQPWDERTEAVECVRGQWLMCSRIWRQRARPRQPHTHALLSIHGALHSPQCHTLLSHHHSTLSIYHHKLHANTWWGRRYQSLRVILKYPDLVWVWWNLIVSFFFSTALVSD